MNKTILLLMIFFSGQIFCQNLKVMTYNIRLDIASDGENSWSNRKEKVFGLIKFHQPDIFGIQEGLPNQVEFLDSILVDFDVIGKGRDGGQKGEHSSIFYNIEKFEVITSNTFWLSETPLKISRGWDAALNRICTYALFRDKKANKFFWVFNTHFDHVGEIARSKSAQLIHQKISELNKHNYPVIIMGDFNLEPETEPILFLSINYLNVKKAAKFVYNSSGTFNAFDFYKPVTKEIDYVFVSKESFLVESYAVITDSNSCKYPSDHFPVLVELQFLN